MKVLLTALNSKYIHTNLAVCSLQQFAAQRGYRSEIAEYTINQHLPDLIDALYRQRPDVLLLSCYIWNIGMMMELAEEYRQVCPEVTFWPAAGGQLSQRGGSAPAPALDGIFIGEGEVPFWEYLQYQNGERPLSQVHSLVWRDGEQIVCNPTAGPLPMEQLPLPIPIWSSCKTASSTLSRFADVPSGAATAFPRWRVGCAICRWSLPSSACSGFWTPGCRRSNLLTAPSTAPRSTRWPSGATLPRTTTA